MGHKCLYLPGQTVPKTGSGTFVCRLEYAGAICLGYCFPFFGAVPLLRTFGFSRVIFHLRVDGLYHGYTPHHIAHILLFDISSSSIRMAIYVIPLSKVTLVLPISSTLITRRLSPTFFRYSFPSGSPPKVYASLPLLAAPRGPTFGKFARSKGSISDRGRGYPSSRLKTAEE